MKDDSALSVVVLPEPVPPETMMLSRVATRRLQVGRHLFGEGAEADEVVDPELLLLEFPDRDEAAVHRDRRDHRVEARAVGKAGVDIGVGFVDPAAHGRHDLVDDPQQVAFVLEGDVGQRELARRVRRRCAAGR